MSPCFRIAIAFNKILVYITPQESTGITVDIHLPEI